MSYRRAWGLVEAMDTMFAEPLVVSARGGSGGGARSCRRRGRRFLHCFARSKSPLRPQTRSGSENSERFWPMCLNGNDDCRRAVVRHALANMTDADFHVAPVVNDPCPSDSPRCSLAGCR
ncbi:MAG: hypothetical protein Q4F04_13610 [Paracoccus sp. (in: a-proteobacteria)]|nr:hypothetical protein [Paracoccus sp. (in: a-proteobacteria)]MDO5371360.1 hypothetical protein [Paracoccus sp. (in: a-proteobacteria)]